MLRGVVPILVIVFSDAMVAKIGSKHGITVDEVLEACTDPVKTSWIYDDEHGRRLLVRGATDSGRRLRVVLYATERHGQFNFGTAMPG